AVRRAGRDTQADRHAAVRRHLDLGPERSLREGHRDRDGQVCPGAGERPVRMWLDMNANVEIAWRSAALARRSLACDLDPLAVRDARRDPGLDRAGAHRPSAARAFLARVVDDKPAAAARLARFREGEAAEIPAALAGALAGRTDP